MTALVFRVLFSFLVAGLLFSVALLGLWLLAFAPMALAWVLGFGAVWVAAFSMIHVRPKS